MLLFSWGWGARTLQRRAEISTPMLREKFENTLLVCLANPALGNESRHELSRRNVEAEICRGAVLRRDADLDMRAVTKTISVAHFFRTALFDRNFVYPI